VKRNNWKYLIDALLFVGICSISVIGLLLAFVIPKGRATYAAKVFLGLHRHEWGDLHLYLSLCLLGLLILHIWLNWTWVVQSTKRYFGGSWKKVLWGMAGAWMIVILIGWGAIRF